MRIWKDRPLLAEPDRNVNFEDENSKSDRRNDASKLIADGTSNLVGYCQVDPNVLSVVILFTRIPVLLK